MKIAVETPSWDWDQIYRILGYGVIGLGFLLAALAFWLLQTERSKETPNVDFLKAVGFFMVFSLCLVLVGFGSEIFKTIYGKNSPAELQKQVDTLTDENKKLQSANDVYAATLGEVWTIKGEYHTDSDPPVQSAGEIEVTAHPPLVVIDPDANTFTTKIFVPREPDGSLNFPRLQIARHLKKEVCTIKFDLAQGTITETGDIISIKSTPTNHEIEILKPIDLASYGPRESSQTTQSAITKIGEPKGLNAH